MHRESLLDLCRERWPNPRTCRLVDSTQNIPAASRDTPLIKKTCYGGMNSTKKYLSVIRLQGSPGGEPHQLSLRPRFVAPFQTANRINNPDPHHATLRHFPRCKYIDHISKLSRRADARSFFRHSEIVGLLVEQNIPTEAHLPHIPIRHPSPLLISTTKYPVRVPSIC